MPIKSRRLALALLLAVTSFPLPASAADPQTPASHDWPGQLGPNGNYSSNETGLLDAFPAGGPPVLWRAATSASYGPLAVAAGRVYAVSATQGVIVKNSKDEAGMIFRQAGDYRGPVGITVYCLDAEKGRELWTRSYEIPGRFPVSDWSARTADGPWGDYFGPKSAPIVDGGRVYSYDHEGTLYCLDAATGQVLWFQHVRGAKYAGLPPRMGYAGPPLVAGPRVVVPLFADDAALLTLDKATGQFAWKGGRVGPVHEKETGPIPRQGNPDAHIDIGKRWDSYSVPVLATLEGRAQIVFYTGGGVQAVDPATGKTLWEFPIKHSTGEVVAPPLFEGNSVIVSSFYADPCTNRFRLENGTPIPVWTSYDLKPRFANVVLYKGYLYGSHGSHVGADYRCLDAATGVPAWTASFKSSSDGPKQMAQTLLADSKLILLTADGTLILAAAKPNACTELGRFFIDLKPGTSEWWMPPALAQGRLYARSTLGEIVCIDLRKKPP